MNTFILLYAKTINSKNYVKNYKNYLTRDIILKNPLRSS
jgi:hypothetical protein